MKYATRISSGKIIGSWLVAAGFFFQVYSGAANTYTLTDNNSETQISTPTDQGMKGWTVDGQSQLYQQWFWYRVGSSGPEKAINTIPIFSQVQATANTLSVIYANAQFSIQTDYTLLGGAPGSGNSEILEQISIHNLTASPLDFHFFQYTDFDVGGTYAGDKVQLFKNLEDLFDRALQSKGNVQFSDTVVSPGSQHGEAGLWPSILNKLTDGDADTLSDNAGPVTGDGTWGLQWDQLIGANGIFTINIDKKMYITPVPEPAAWSLVPLGLVVIGMVRRYRAR